MRTKIYTRTGDSGTSALFTGERRPKTDAVFDGLGATDELSAWLGLARAALAPDDSRLSRQLEIIQCRLQDVGSQIATPGGRAGAHALPDFGDTHTQQLESWIDAMDEQLPRLRAFILPGGGSAGATLHIARTVCRRAERRLAPLALSQQLPSSVFRFVNRLSDYLFTAARFAAHQAGQPDAFYTSASES